MYFCNTYLLLPIKFCPIMIKALLFKTVSWIAKLSAIALLLFVIQTESKAQSADFAIKWSHAYDLGDTLTVYMRSSTTINFPFNQVSTGQVTLRVPTGMLPFFDGSGGQTTNDNDTLFHHNNGHWANNARFNLGDVTNNLTHYPGGTLTTHQDNNDYDYVSFGLTTLGTRNIEFVAGDELPLFSFFFPNGSICTDSIPIFILDHVEDTSFMANGITSPNNNLSVLGPGGDIYSGNYWDYGARCYDYDNDDVHNTDDYCDYTLEVDIPGVDTSGCTDFDGDGFYPDDNPTPADEDASTTTNVIDPPAVTETYNKFDPDIANTCIPQGDSLRGGLSLYKDGVEFSGTDPDVARVDICAGDTIVLIVKMIETESVDDANNYASPFDYDHRGVYNITINSSLGGDMTVPAYTSGDSIKVTPTEDGTVFTLVQVVDTFLCNAIELDSLGRVDVMTGAGLAIIDGDMNICDGDTALVSISVSGGIANYVVQYTDGTTVSSVTMDGDTVLRIPNLSANAEYTLVSVVDQDGNGCSTPTEFLNGAATITFADKVTLTAPTVMIPSDCNATDGSIVVNTTTTPVGIEYSIDNGVTWQASATFSSLGPGSYVVAVRVNGNNSCMTVWPETFNMASTAAPVFAAVNENQPNDCAANVGSIEVLVQGVPANLTAQYELRDAGTGLVIGGADYAYATSDSLFENVPDGNYLIYVRYHDGTNPSCEVQFPGGAEINGINFPTLGALTSNSSTDCREANGEVALTASSIDGFALEYRLVRGPGDTTAWGTQNLFTSLSEGSYNVQYRNAGTTNCEVLSAPQVIVEPDTISLGTSAHADIQKCLEETGTITLSGTSENASTLEYSIDGGATWQAGALFSGLAPGTYNGSVRNQADQSCLTPYSSAIQITRPEDIVLINPLKTDETDCAASDGTITAQVGLSDGDSTLTFEIAGPSGTVQVNDPAFLSLAAGTYNVKAYYADGVSCRDSIDITIDGRNSITAAGIATNSPDCGVAGGELQVINLVAVDGAVEYSRDTGTTWQPGNVFSNLGTITTDMVVRYADGKCETTVTGGPFVLTEPVPTDISIPDVSVNDPAQCGDRATIVIDTASFTGSDHEFSIDGSTFQADTSFAGLAGGVYLITVRNSITPSCFDTVSIAVANNEAPELRAKVYLQGAFNTGTGVMNDDLRDLGVIPTSSPYISGTLTSLGADTTATGGNGVVSHIDQVDVINDYQAISHTSAMIDTVLTDILDDKASNSIVDWILVELRPFHDSTIITSRRVGLVQRDGDIVTWVDGESPLIFKNACATEDTTYYVSIKHRNHMGAMTLDPVAFHQGPVNLDFTSSDLQLYKLPTSGFGLPVEPMATLSNGKRALWGGNVAFNRRVLFQGGINDPSLISNVVLGHGNNTASLTNFIANGYYNSDVNMDGVTIFQGAPNDVDIIFFNIMGNPSNTNFQASFILREQLPQN